MMFGNGLVVLLARLWTSRISSMFGYPFSRGNLGI